MATLLARGDGTSLREVLRDWHVTALRSSRHQRVLRSKLLRHSWALWLEVVSRCRAYARFKMYAEYFSRHRAQETLAVALDAWRVAKRTDTLWQKVTHAATATSLKCCHDAVLRAVLGAWYARRRQHSHRQRHLCGKLLRACWTDWCARVQWRLACAHLQAHTESCLGSRGQDTVVLIWYIWQAAWCACKGVRSTRQSVAGAFAIRCQNAVLCAVLAAWRAWTLRLSRLHNALRCKILRGYWALWSELVSRHRICIRLQTYALSCAAHLVNGGLAAVCHAWKTFGCARVAARRRVGLMAEPLLARRQTTSLRAVFSLWHARGAKLSQLQSTLCCKLLRASWYRWGALVFRHRARVRLHAHVASLSAHCARDTVALTWHAWQAAHRGQMALRSMRQSTAGAMSARRQGKMVHAVLGAWHSRGLRLSRLHRAMRRKVLRASWASWLRASWVCCVELVSRQRARMFFLAHAVTLSSCDSSRPHRALAAAWYVWSEKFRDARRVGRLIQVTMADSWREQCGRARLFWSAWRVCTAVRSTIYSASRALVTRCRDTLLRKTWYAYVGEVRRAELSNLATEAERSPARASSLHIQQLHPHEQQHRAPVLLSGGPRRIELPLAQSHRLWAIRLLIHRLASLVSGTRRLALRWWKDAQVSASHRKLAIIRLQHAVAPALLRARRHVWDVLRVFLWGAVLRDLHLQVGHVLAQRSSKTWTLIVWSFWRRYTHASRGQHNFAALAAYVASRHLSALGAIHLRLAWLAWHSDVLQCKLAAELAARACALSGPVRRFASEIDGDCTRLLLQAYGGEATLHQGTLARRVWRPAARSLALAAAAWCRWCVAAAHALLVRRCLTVVLRRRGGTLRAAAFNCWVRCLEAAQRRRSAVRCLVAALRGAGTRRWQQVCWQAGRGLGALPSAPIARASTTKGQWKLSVQVSCDAGPPRRGPRHEEPQGQVPARGHPREPRRRRECWANSCTPSVLRPLASRDPPGGQCLALVGSTVEDEPFGLLADGPAERSCKLLVRALSAWRGAAARGRRTRSLSAGP